MPSTAAAPTPATGTVATQTAATDIATTQTQATGSAAEPEVQPVLVQVAPVQKKSYTK